MALSQDNSVLNCNSNTQNTALPQPNTLFPFPVNQGDIFPQPRNGTNPGSSDNEPQHLNMGPGLYAIVCGKSHKIYFKVWALPTLMPSQSKIGKGGESENVVKRLGLHYAELVGGKHECKELQEAWSSNGKESFSFLSLSVGPQWVNITARQKAEDQLIKLNPTIVYNQSIAGSTPKKQSDIYRKLVSFKVWALPTLMPSQSKIGKGKGTVYPSIAEASRKTGVSETHIRRLVRDPQNTFWQYVNDTSGFNDTNIINIEKAKTVKVHGKIYRSIREASNDTGIARRTLQRHLESNKPEHAYATYVDT